MLTYNLFKTQSMLLSATSKKGQPDADLQTVQNPEHALVSNKQEGPARCLTYILFKTQRHAPCQQQAGSASQILTYILFKTQGMLLSAPQDKPKKNINLHSVYNQSTFLLASS
jgi:hypothetical protein